MGRRKDILAMVNVVVWLMEYPEFSQMLGTSASESGQTKTLQACSFAAGQAATTSQANKGDVGLT